MDGKTQAMQLAHIIEEFMVQLMEGHWIGPCECCGFPVPAPFHNEETDELLCRNCRIAHENGEH